MNDRDVVAAQIDRPTRSPVEVVARCHLGLPVSIEVPPLLDDGTPFPTTYWLTCPLAVRRIGRLESAGGVRAAERRLGGDAIAADRYAAAMTRYAAYRDSLLPGDYGGPRPSGGIAGTRAGVKCLHAQYADHVSGNDNPVGEWTAADIEPLDCTVPCVEASGGAIGRNPQWVEPPR